VTQETSKTYFGYLLYAMFAAGWIVLLVGSFYRGWKEPGPLDDEDLMPPGAW
jgi:hypothetical protein